MKNLVEIGPRAKREASLNGALLAKVISGNKISPISAN
jgi:hypothetical protein